ncbi:MAG: T9SS type A sorting domain-containing protein [Saprospiraceae bacterium]|nr:T9SS type A sorting domain-containing protein [Saprospiraceae bacterium]
MKTKWFYQWMSRTPGTRVQHAGLMVVLLSILTVQTMFATTTNALREPIGPVASTDFPRSGIENPDPAFGWCYDVIVYLDGSGYGNLTVADALNDSQANASDYILTVKGNHGSNLFTCSNLGERISYVIRNKSNNFTCTGWVKVMDTLAPQISCSGGGTYFCQDALDEVKPTAVDNDNCGELSFTFKDNMTMNPDCRDMVHALTITRVWTVTDRSGNSASCTQNFTISRPSVFAVEIPKNIVLECPVVNTDPAVTGVPTINGKPFTHLCGAIYSYKDQIKKECGNTYVIWRKWFITEWCTKIVREQYQVITVVDRTPPTAVFADTIEISTDHHSAMATYMVMGPASVEDACSPQVSVTAVIDNKVIVDKGAKVQLKKGYHTIKYVVKDGCGNETMGSTVIHVYDNEPPQIVCHDITVEVAVDSFSTVCLDDLPISATDNCGDVDLSIRKDEDLCNDGINDLVYKDCVTFCCDDESITYVTVRGIDPVGNVSTCRFRVTVVGTGGGVPNISVLPATDTITCGQTIQWATPTIESICGIDVNILIDTIENSLSVCGVGAITRRYIAVNTSNGLRDTATQRIVVINENPFTVANIVCPDDLDIIGCSVDDAMNLPDLQYTGLSSLDCYEIDTTYRVTTSSSPQFCIILTRNWTIFDLCQPDSFWTCTQTIRINDTTAPVLSGPRDMTIYSDTLCQAPVNLDSVVAIDCDPNVIITNSFGGGPKVDTILPVGEYVISFYGLDNCGNRDTLDVSVSILDTVPPTLVCKDSTINCGDPIPQVFFVTSDNCITTSVNLISNTSEMDDCGKGRILRVYEAKDASGNSTRCTQTITISGSGLFTETDIHWPATPVTLTDCPDPANLNTGTTAVDTAGKPCISVYVSSSDSIGKSDSFCLIIYRTWTVIDSCNLDPASGLGRWDSVQVIQINDNTPPVLSGPSDITVGSGPNCTAQVTLDTVTASDCDPFVQITNSEGGGAVYSGTLPAGVNTITFFGRDSCGNVDSLVVHVTVTDTIPPVLACSGDVTVTCGGPVNGITPDATDACGQVVSITKDSTILSGPCGRDTVVYRFIAIDDSGNRDTCSYRAIFQPAEPFSCSYVDLAMDTIRLNSCTASTHPDSLPGSRPTVDLRGACYAVEITWEDETLSNGGAQCLLEVRRTWHIVDTCGGANDSCSVVQIIEVEDQDSPILTAPRDTCVFAPDTARGYVIVTLPAATAEDCDPDVQITNDFNNQGATISDTFYLGQTLVTFYAQDACGNRDTATTLVEIKDVTPPQFACHKIFREVSNDPVPTVVVRPLEFISNVTDNFTDSTNIWFSFSSNINDTLRTYTCDSVGLLYVTIVGTDASGNQDTCLTLIRVLDTLGFCPTPFVTIGGSILTPDGKVVEDVEVQARGDEPGKAMSDEYGIYEINQIKEGQDYAVTPVKQDDPRNGLSVLDLIVLKKHILGIQEFTKPEQFLAGDIDMNGSLSTLDVFQLQKLLVGAIDHWEHGQSWRFYTADYRFADPLNPWTDAIPESILIHDMQRSAMHSDFIGVKLGDFDGSVRTTHFQQADIRSNLTTNWHLTNQHFQAGELVTIPVYGDNGTWQGWQASLAFANSGLELIRVDAGDAWRDAFDYFVDDSGIQVIGASASPIVVRQDEPLFTLTYLAHAAGRVDEAIQLQRSHLTPEAYQVNDEPAIIQLNFDEESVPEAKFELFQNQPNPFAEYTEIRFYVPLTSEVSLKVWDATGRVLVDEHQSYNKGVHQVHLDSELNGAQGVLYYQIQSGSYVVTRKMIRIN